MKNLFSALLLTAGIVGAATTAQAQSSIEFGPRLGLNISTFSYQYPNIPVGLSNEAKALTGVQVGGTLNMSFGKIAFQPSLLFSQKGAELKFSAVDNTSVPYVTTVNYVAKPKLNYLEIPLNVVYTSQEDHGFQLFAGPYVAFGVGGSGTSNLTITSNDPDVLITGAANSFPVALTIEYGSRQNANEQLNNASNNGINSSPTVIATFRRFDAGLNAGVGYRFGPFQAQLGYGLGLLNLTPNDPDGNETNGKIYNRGFQLAANYFFGSK
ncbi:porin family protein [Hymenobacter convexus]|uniref:porin family protein n=1 Tax=Hymenobacter sp. CA1UV-4 TaxID=3063782 RepID=UPI0027132813|nr:porin family protein [Hymenobacter sp. CA1UV-4]MDO7854648.1 porin family protein [Hymenobacter sp. CA1UV-4]